MRYYDIINYSIKNLRRRELRSWLTILGIVIGIAAIVALVSIAQGLDVEIKKELELFGTDMIIITPAIPVSAGGMETGESYAYGPRIGRLTESDAEAIKRIEGVKSVAVVIDDRLDIGYRNKNISSYVYGVEPVMFTEMYEVEVELGRHLKEFDRNGIVIGHSIANDIFKEKIHLNSKINIGKESFRVIGILKKRGGMGPMAAVDNMVYITKDDARELMDMYKGNKEVGEIHVKAKKGVEPKKLEKDIEKVLLRRHKVSEKDKDFTLITAEFVLGIIGQITGFLTLFLGGVAGISLLVGGIGIANTMFMCVLERTREIGTLKAIGAKNSIILQLFLFESGLIGLIGGVIGVIFGIGISYGLSFFRVPSLVSIELILFALAFSFFVGLVSGFFPARRASLLEPIEALRYG